MKVEGAYVEAAMWVETPTTQTESCTFELSCYTTHDGVILFLDGEANSGGARD
jgi:hypothetical protein